MTILIPRDCSVTFGMATVPGETPFGIMEQSVMTCSFEGRTFHLLDDDMDWTRGGRRAMDMETGDVVILEVEQP